jgi:hypothetical protein
MAVRIPYVSDSGRVSSHHFPATDFLMRMQRRYTILGKTASRGTAILYPAVLALALIGPVRALASAPSGEDLFRWGEYDSLIRVLEPEIRSGALAQLSDASDSTARAKTFLFLGVAFYATGNPTRADEAFRTACRLDPDVRIDRFYVTEEIANHFQTVAMDVHPRPPAAATGNLKADAKAPVKAGNGPARSDRNPGLKDTRGKSWLWWSLGFTALAVAGGGAYYLATDQDEGEPRVTTIKVGGE